MGSDDKKKPVYLGFLTALGSPVHGLIGGFLVLNLAGRPTEFHCTAPVRPNRAQEILYGATLESFVCGEQIAPALVGRTKLELTAILTNNPNMLSALPLLNVPIGLVMSHVPSPDSDDKSSQQFAEWDRQKDGIKKEASGVINVEAQKDVSKSSDGLEQASGTLFYESLDSLPFVPGVDYSRWRETVRGKNRLALPADFRSETKKVSFDECVAQIDPFLKSIDSVEPFERIRLAVEEAQKSC